MQTSLFVHSWRSLLCLALILAAIAVPARAQQPVSAPRSDGQQTPLLFYPAVGPVGCAPLAVISHGAGGSEYGLSYLAQSMAQRGYNAIVLGHRESGKAALEAHVSQQVDRDRAAGMTALLTDPKAEGDRLLDVSAALQWSESRCKSPFRVLLGHSMGAETVLLEAGAVNRLGIASPPAAQNRFNAYVALSPEGPGLVFPQNAWSHIDVPVLMLTGTRDGSRHGTPEWRKTPWQSMPGARGTCQWLGVVDGATHKNFGGNGPGADRVTPQVTRTIGAFLAGVRSGSCKLPAAEPAMTLQAK